MLVYFTPSYQKIPFPLWHKFYGVQLHVLCCVTNPIRVDPHSKGTSIEDMNPVKDYQTGASILYTLRWHSHFISVTERSTSE
jgi:hypothetical protein